MSLQVWLPLNGNLNNCGVAGLTATSNALTINSAGKIGSCYSFNGSSSYIAISGFSIGNTWSYGCWFNSAASTRSLEGLILLNNNHGDDDTQLGLYTYPNASRIQSTANGQYNSSISHTYDNQWHHLFATFDGSTLKTYLDGAVIDTKAITAALLPRTNLTIGARCRGNSGYDVYYSGKINDVRIYDSCLSAEEVKNIAKGLILHYPLNQEISTMNNCYSLPTFDTSTPSAQWHHWDRSGAIGTYGQSTDTNYIFNGAGSRYAHWVKNADTATGEYLLYQSPDFEGGYRSLQVIVKEVNSTPITDAVCFPAWNAPTSASVPNNHWTSIDYLGNGFYLCKCEGINQDGSNDLVGVYIKPGYTVYFTCAYVENNRIVCSDIFNQTPSTVYDVSGYNRNGTKNGTLQTTFDTCRYSKATEWVDSASSISIGNLSTIVPEGIFTFNVWFKKETGKWSSKNRETILGGPSGFDIESKPSNSSTNKIRLYSWGGNDGSKDFTYPLDQWNMLTMVRTASETTWYLNAEQVQTGTAGTIPSGDYFLGAWSTATDQNYMGKMSDARFYATALSADDIKDLYNAPIKVCKGGMLVTNGEVIE